MKLRTLIIFLGLIFIVGLIVWFVFQQLNQEKNLYSVIKDAPDIFSQSNSTELQKEENPLLSQRLLHELTSSDVAQMREPFTEIPCYYQLNEKSCLPSYKTTYPAGLEIVEGQVNVSTLTTLQKRIALSQMIGTADNVRTYFQNQPNNLDYFVFSRQVLEKSEELYFSPTLIYAFYDYFLLKTDLEEVENLPEPALIVNQLAAGDNIYRLNDESERANLPEEIQDWKIESLAFLHLGKWFLKDLNKVQLFFSNHGEFENYYKQRFGRQSAEQFYRLPIVAPEIQLNEYFLATDPTPGLALCQNEQAMLCQFEPLTNEDVQKMNCRRMPFIDRMCDQLINIH